MASNVILVDGILATSITGLWVVFPFPNYLSFSGFVRFVVGFFINFFFPHLSFFLAVCWFYCCSSVCDCLNLVCGIWVSLVAYLLLLLLLPTAKIWLLADCLCSFPSFSHVFHHCCNVSFCSLMKIVNSWFLNHRADVKSMKFNWHQIYLLRKGFNPPPEERIS